MFHAQRFTVFTFTVLLMCFASSTTDGGDGLTMEPYTVFVAESESHARCGPAADYYRTDPLKHGQQLQVYAETKEGWLGVRPPENSFCWIPAETADVDGSGEMGTITEDRTVAWIGTHLGRARKYLWQVQLAEGEPVTIIGRQERDGPDGPQLWLRIVPPSGEFRWIHRDQTVQSSEELVKTIQINAGDTSQTPVQFQPAGPTHVDRINRHDSPKIASDRQRDVNSGKDQNNSQRRSSRNQKSIDQSGRSVLRDVPSRQVTTTPAASADVAIGSGVAIESGVGDQWQASETPTPPDINLPSSLSKSAGLPPAESTPKPRGLLASMAILGRPRMKPIGAEPATAKVTSAQAPTQQNLASDDNWVSGAANRSRRDTHSVAITGAPMTIPATPISTQAMQPFETSHQSSNEILQVTGVTPLPAQNLIPTSQPSLRTATVSPQLKPPVSVSAEQIKNVHDQVHGATIESMRLVLSRLMAAQSSAAEVRVVANAARDLMSQSVDSVVIGQARLLAERADQYARLADRRDGQASIQPPLATPSIAGVTSTSTAAATVPVVASEPNQASMSGQLVQVYSARTHSPPFALTDGTGRTIAYVTPSPGINLRMHLNQQITVTGTQGFVTGLNMPHIMAMRADR